MCSATRHARFTPNSDQKSRHAANGHVCFTPKSAITHLAQSRQKMVKAGMRIKNDYSKEIKIAAELRKLIPRQRAVLFHGTQHPCSILKYNCLIYPRHLTHGGVSFTRLFHVGIYWACLHRDLGENQGAVFVLDRDRLARDFRLTPYCWRGWGSDKSRGDFEAEESVFGRDIPQLHRYLLEVVWLPEALCLPPPIERKLSASEWIELLNIAGVKGAHPPKRHKPQQIITKLRQVQTMVSQGEILTEAIRAIGTSETTYRRWEKDYSALTMKTPKTPSAANLE